MTDERHARISELFLAVCDLSVDQRQTYLERECPDDPDLVQEVLELTQQDDGDAVIDTPLPIPELLAPELAEPPVHPKTIGGYQLIDVLGEGGMGIVYRAKQDSPQREVALKVIRGGLASDESFRRFQFEAEILARLQHPGIATLYEAGVSQVGNVRHPFFALELVHGPRLDQFVRDNNLSLEGRLRLLSRLCDVVQYAHQQGVIHRDLKPSNILIDDRGQPRVLDFGIARISDAEATRTLETRPGQLMGTLPYMSPEQVLGDPGQIDARSDVYALGVLCYELISGKLPLQVNAEQLPKAIHQIVEENPTPLGKHDTKFRGDLETIIAKALEKEKNRRYVSAAALGQDLQRYLQHEPIQARPPTTFYQLSKFARRHRTLVGAFAIAAASLIAGTAVAIEKARQATRSEQQAIAAKNKESAAKRQALDAATRESQAKQEALDARDQADQAKERAIAEQLASEEVNRFLIGMLHSVRPTELGSEVLVVDVLDRAMERLQNELLERPLIRARLYDTLGGSYTTLSKHIDAYAAYQLAASITAELHGEKSMETLSLRMNMLHARTLTGEAKDCIPRFHDLMEEVSAQFGEDHEFVTDIINRIGESHMIQGEFVEAKPYFEDAVRRSGQKTPHHKKHDTFLSNLAVTTGHFGDFEQARQLYEETIQRGIEQYGEISEQVLRRRLNLAQLVRTSGRFQEAAIMYKDLLADQKLLDGDDHPDTMRTLGSLGRCYIQMGEYEKALQPTEQAYQFRRQHLGPENPQTLTNHQDLINLWYLSGEQDKALTANAELLQIRRRVSGRYAPVTVQVAENQGLMLVGLGRLQQAVEVLQETLVDSEQTFGKTGAQTLKIQGSLANALLGLNEIDEAAAALGDAPQQLEAMFGPTHPNTTDAKTVLGHVLLQQGKLQFAEECFWSLYEILKEQRGPLQPQTLETLEKAAQAGAARADESSIESNLWQAWELLDDQGPSQNPERLRLIVKGLCHLAEYNSDLLLELEDRLSAMRDQLMEQDADAQLLTVIVELSLGKCQRLWDDPELALEHFAAAKSLAEELGADDTPAYIALLGELRELNTEQTQ